MLVVADSSPLIMLVGIGHVEVLPTLFGQVVVPSQVVAELKDARRSVAVRSFIKAPPSWLVEHSPTSVEAIPRLHAGEQAAISLVRELKADLLLIDEAAGRHAAAERGIAFTGTIGVLERAAGRGLLDLRSAFDAVKRTSFWVSHSLLDERLRLFLAAQNGR